jgi:hypothetical protein
MSAASRLPASSERTISAIQDSLSSRGHVIAICPEYGDKDDLPFLESFLLLADELRARGHDVLFFFRHTDPDIFRQLLGHYPSFKLPADRFAELSVVDVFFVMDDLAFTDARFPQRSAVVGFRHGLVPVLPDNDNPYKFIELAPESTICDFVVRTNANASTFTPDAWAGVVTDMFPPALHTRPSTTLGVIPGGYLKLDLYSNACTDRTAPPNALLFAPTHIKAHRLCVDFLARFGIEILTALLKHFPDYQVIFRPYPGDREEAVVRDIATHCRNHPQLLYDTSGDIKNTYSRSLVLIGDLSHASYSFCFSKLAPYIACKFDHAAELQAHALGYNAHDAQQVVDSVAQVLAQPNDWRTRIRHERAQRISNAGRTAEYLAEHLSDILSPHQTPGWAYIPKLSDPQAPWQPDDYCDCAHAWLASESLPRLLRYYALLVIKEGLRHFPVDSNLLTLETQLLQAIDQSTEQIKYYA